MRQPPSPSEWLPIALPLPLHTCRMRHGSSPPWYGTSLDFPVPQPPQRGGFYSWDEIVRWERASWPHFGFCAIGFSSKASRSRMHPLLSTFTLSMLSKHFPLEGKKSLCCMAGSLFFLVRCSHVYNGGGSHKRGVREHWFFQTRSLRVGSNDWVCQCRVLWQKPYWWRSLLRVQAFLVGRRELDYYQEF